jgi:hypothetical protein
LLGRNGNPRPSSHAKDFAFTGLIRCGECSSMVTAEEKHQLICGACRHKFAYRQRQSCPRCGLLIERMKAPRFLHYTYYHCTKSRNPECSQPGVSAPNLENQIECSLAQIQISSKFKEWAIKFAHELHARESSDMNSIIHQQQKAYRDCLHRLGSLVSLKTSPANADGGLISEEEYRGQRMELLKEKAALEELSRDAGQGVEHSLALTERVFEFACSARDRFATGSIQTQKTILATLGSNLTLKDKKLRIEAKEPFFMLEKSDVSCPTSNDRIEPKIHGSTKAQTDSNFSRSSRGLRDVDEVRTFGTAERKLVSSIYHFFRSVTSNPRSEYFLN